MSTVGGYLDYRGDIMIHVGDILSTVGDIMIHVGDILSTVGGVQYCEGYHEFWPNSLFWSNNQ